MIEICRICGSTLSGHDYFSPAPSLTSVATLLDIPTQTTACRICGHLQSPDLPRIREFYDTQYRISLQSEQHDQLYEIRAGKPIYRTEYQAELLNGLGIPYGARVLDFGAAKGTTLRQLLRSRPDLKPSIYDVSIDYLEAWQGWVAEDEQAIHHLPGAWQGRFDLITAHFVLEHVADPIGSLRTLSTLLAPTGRLFFTVPDPLANTGDMLVVDHLNHFTKSSLQSALQAAGLQLITLSESQFRGAFVVTANPSSQPSGRWDDRDAVASDVSAALRALKFWTSALQSIDKHQLSISGGSTAIYGAGFYGALIASRLLQPPVCFLDRNPFLQGHEYMGVPVFAPEDCPSHVQSIYAGLNPIHAHDILSDANDWLPLKATIFYLAAA